MAQKLRLCAYQGIMLWKRVRLAATREKYLTTPALNAAQFAVLLLDPGVRAQTHSSDSV
jgi:hypothetical protein